MTTTPTEDIVDGYFDFFASKDAYQIPIGSTSEITDILWSGGASTQLEYYMRGKDIDCGILTYRYWTTINAPDPTGSSYSGTKCGANPLEDIVVLSIKVIQL